VTPAVFSLILATSAQNPVRIAFCLSAEVVEWIFQVVAVTSSRTFALQVCSAVSGFVISESESSPSSQTQDFTLRIDDKGILSDRLLSKSIDFTRHHPDVLVNALSDSKCPGP
jgi:hypothetical protein